MSKSNRYSPEAKKRAVRMLFEHEKEYESRWLATVSIAGKIGCTPQTLRTWAVGSVGDSYDNVLAETINGLYKTEVIRRQGPWRNIEAGEFATLTWVDWFNNHRLFESIGPIPPAEHGSNYYQQIEGSAKAA
jgi:hypothetical protein